VHARVQKKGQERLMSKDVRFAPKEEQCPHHEAGTFADQHQQRRLAKIDPVKAERDGKDIADKGIYLRAKEVLEIPQDNKFTLSKKLNALLDIDASIFNKVVFTFLKDKNYPISYLDSFSLLEHEDNLNRDDIFKLLRESGVGVPAYYEKIPFTVDGQTGEYARSRSGCYFCFFQQRIEWIWLYEQHPDLFKKAMEYEKNGYTWIQGERLESLIKPERLRQIKLDAIKRSEKNAVTRKSPYLVDMLIDAENMVCANCFI